MNTQKRKAGEAKSSEAEKKEGFPFSETTPDVAAEISHSKASEPKSIPYLQIPKRALDLAKGVGIDLEPLIEWGMNIEARTERLEKGIETLGVKLTPVIQLAQRVEQMRSQPQMPAETNPMPGGMGSLLQLLPALMGGGGNPISEELTQKLMELSIKRMEQDLLLGGESTRVDISIGKAIKNAIVSKYAAKAVGELMP